MQVYFDDQRPAATAIPPLFQVLVGENARISGLLKSVTGSAVMLSVPWQSADIRVARPGVQAVFQRPGEARVFADVFRQIDPLRWTVTGKPEVLGEPEAGSPRQGLKIPAGGASVCASSTNRSFRAGSTCRFVTMAKCSPARNGS